MSVEVERKFVCDPEIHTKLKDIGAICIGQRRFQDQYFDSPDFDLTLKDFWLRCREGCWELKCPVVPKTQKHSSQAEGLCSRYREITTVPEIQAEIAKAMAGRLCHPIGSCKDDDGDDNKATETSDVGSAAVLCDDSMADWLRERNLTCFAKYTTERCSFSLAEDGVEGVVRVDLDQADFGYCVGEIEVLVADGGDIQAAQQRIERTADKLGLSSGQRVEGKMDVYLQRNNPDHYAKLLAAHIL
ncbi:thiamine-triphosphatase [Engraulis encrasicolus]|uniref:thiamine-triphosphatase n=1 Tax=Engraulis encrasicolus TaxID=184585 RepID=UPI002FD08233